MDNTEYLNGHALDVCFVIDTSIEPKRLEAVKKNLQPFVNDLVVCASKYHKHIQIVRIKLITCSNSKIKYHFVQRESDFFELPKDNKALEEEIELVEFSPNNGLCSCMEALGQAIRSEWYKDTEELHLLKKRQVIVAFSDKGTYEPGHSIERNKYVKSIDELTEWWGDKCNPGYMDQFAKRLILFAPDMQCWSFVADNWDKTIWFPSNAGSGLSEVDYDTILNTVYDDI